VPDRVQKKEENQASRSVARQNAPVSQQADDAAAAAAAAPALSVQQTLGNRAGRRRANAIVMPASPLQNAAAPQQASPQAGGKDKQDPNAAKGIGGSGAIGAALKDQTQAQQGQQQTESTSDPRLPNPLPKGFKAVMKSIRGAQLRDFYVEEDDKGADVYKVKEDTKISRKIKFREELEIYNSVTDSKGEWVLAKIDGRFGFVRKEKVAPKGASLSDASAKAKDELKQKGGKTVAQALGGFKEEEKSTLEKLHEKVSMVNTVAGKVSGKTGEKREKAEEDLKDFTKDLPENPTAEQQQEKAQKENKLKGAKQMDAIVNVVAAPVDAITAGLGGIVALRNILQAARDKEKTRAEKGFEIAENVADAAKSGQGMVSAVAKTTESIAYLAGNEGVAEVAESVGKWSGSLGDAIDAAKSVVMVVKNIYEMYQKAVSEEGISKGEVFEGTLTIVSNLLEAAKGAVGTAKSILEILNNAGASQALGTALPGIGIAISGVTIAIEVYHIIKAYVHQKRMTAVKREFKEKYKQSGFVKKRDDITLFGKTLFHFNLGTDKKKLELYKKSLEDIANDPSKPKEKREAALKQLSEIQEYELAKDMKDINIKRIKRSAFIIGQQLLSIAGDIATLTGTGATAGAVLKGVASGAGVARTASNWLKQKGRNYAAQHPNGYLARIFDANKSDANKKKQRVKDANLILQMIANLPEFSPETQDQYKRVQNFIAATGVDLHRFFAKNGDLEAQRKLLVEAMAKRN